MLCERPFRKGVLELGCGGCKPCRVNRSRLWVGRMILESYEHQNSCFVTLTYDEQHLPENKWLNKKDLQLFLKRLRTRFSNRAIRFFATGEYGDQTWRPHYHLILFGVSPLEVLEVQKCWLLGHIVIGTAEAKSMSYCASYVVKKMNNPKDSRLEGRPPEFCTMSLRPGLGYGIVDRIKKAVEMSPAFDRSLISQVRCGPSKYPLGRYLRNKVDSAIGVLPESRRDRLRTLIEAKFAEVITEGTQRYEERRKARVQAGLGKLSITKGKSL